MKNNLTQTINYEKTTFDKNNNLESVKCDVRELRKNPQINILLFKKAYGMKVSQSIIYVKGYF